MSKYKHLFFDLDHTLWDFEKNSELTWRFLYEKHGFASIGLPDFETFFTAYNVYNDRLWERFRNGFIKREEMRWKRIWQTFLEFKVYSLPLVYQLSDEYLQLLPTQTALMPFAKEILDYCKANYKLHLITNGFETTQWEKLRHAGIADYFEHVITSEKSNSMKPHPEIFDYALKLTGADLKESLMIGDALEIDVMGAQNAGWDAVYYNPLKLAHTKKPTYEITHFEELLKIV